MRNILDTIAVSKSREVAAAKALLPEELMRDIAHECRREALSMKANIRNAKLGIIAEFKRRSPSKGEIHPVADVTTIVKSYEEGGASGCSILTDTPFFGGSLADLDVARYSAKMPLLRKDFIIAPYQILQAKIHGADAILLIASLLDYHKVGEYTDFAHEYGLEVLLELHTPEERDRYFSEIDLVGVNSRNLSNFNTNLSVAEQMMKVLPESSVKIAESGINSAEDIKKLREIGYDGFLIGEMFMRDSNPGAVLNNLLN